MVALRHWLGLLSLLAPALLAAQDGDWDDWEEPSPTEWSGYLELAHAPRFDANPLIDERATRSEAKAQLEVGHVAGAVEWKGKVDLYADAVLDEFRVDVREARVALPLGPRVHVDLGRQVSTWGLGDLLFINDRFPKDFETPLAGGEDFYFKAPANTARLAIDAGVMGLDLAWTPRFTPDRYIDGERLGFYDPRSQQRVGGDDLIDADEPSGGEWAARLHRARGGIEVAAYLYRGYDKQPLAVTADGRPTHARRDLAGFSLRAPWAGGIVSLEAGREWPRNGGRELLLRVPAKTSAMLAFEKEWWPKFTAGIQLYHESHGSEAGNPSPLNGAERHLLSLRLTRQALRDRLVASVIHFWSPDDRDRWSRLTLSYRYSDDWLAGITANHFQGRADRFFGQLEPDSQFGAWLRRQF